MSIFSLFKDGVTILSSDNLNRTLKSLRELKIPSESQMSDNTVCCCKWCEMRSFDVSSTQSIFLIDKSHELKTQIKVQRDLYRFATLVIRIRLMMTALRYILFYSV